MTDAYHGEFELAASAEMVFAHLVEPHLLTEWWPDGAATDPTPGGEYHLWWDGPDWHLRGEYDLVDPPNRLVYTWQWDHEDYPPRRVDMRLSIMKMGKTHLVVEHEAASEEERSSYQQGWEFFLPQLGDAAAAASDHN